MRATFWAMDWLSLDQRVALLVLDPSEATTPAPLIRNQNRGLGDSPDGA